MIISQNLNPAFAEAIIEWFSQNARDLPFRKDRDPYRVWVSEIMLQQTRVEAALPHYKRFMEELPTIGDLARVPDDKLHKLWEGLGYYTRATNLKKAAIVILEEHGGVFPQNHDEIIKLPGIGPYTAGAVSSICFGEATPAVDGNVLRAVTRYLGLYDNIDNSKTKKHITELLRNIYTKENAQPLTEGLMELGALVCLPSGSPKCATCPLAAGCITKRDGLSAKIPVKQKKKPRKFEQKTIFLLNNQGRYAICQRGDKGLLANLYALPMVESHLEKPGAHTLLERWGLQPSAIENSISHTHIFTHIEWDMISYHIVCGLPSDRFLWKTLEEIKRDFALPTAFRKFIVDLPLSEAGV